MVEMQPWLLQECFTAQGARLFTGNLVCGEGVADQSDGSLLVTTGGAGLNLSVAEGGGFVDSDADDMGMYSVFNDGPTTVTATAADGTNPRIDQVIATVNDAQIAGVDNDWVLSVLAGTPTGGATLSNLNGATALPDRTIRLAYVLVPATFVGPFVDATHILDARSAFQMCSGQPYVELEPAAATSIPNTAAFTQPTMATVVNIDRAYFSVSGATVTVLFDGLYDLESVNGMAADGTGIRRAVILLNNTNLPNASPDGSVIADVMQASASGTVASTVNLGRRNRFITAGTTIKTALAHNGAGALDSYAAGPLAHITIRKVG